MFDFKEEKLQQEELWQVEEELTELKRRIAACEKKLGKKMNPKDSV